MNKPSFTNATYRPRAPALARTAVLVNDYRNFLSLLYLGLLLSALERDKNGNSEKILQENGGEFNYVYADTTNPFKQTSETTPLGYVTQYTYDANGNVSQMTLPSSKTVAYANYTAFAQPGKVKDPRGNYTLAKYDPAKGNLLQTSVLKAGFGAAVDPASYAPAASELMAQSINTYDLYGNLTTVKRVKDFATQAGPTITYNYAPQEIPLWDDASKLNVTSISRTGDVNGDGSVTKTSPTMVYDTYGRATTSLKTRYLSCISSA
ncbi:MAG: RHS repeat protein [Propionivibrio sp.]|nr:RHS repeat protein [Propionivibrio sp.]